eukprot:1701686-Pyramimonas_sp.AAC.1
MCIRDSCRGIHADKGTEAARGRVPGQREGHLHDAHSNPLRQGHGRKTRAVLARHGQFLDK